MERRKSPGPKLLAVLVCVRCKLTPSIGGGACLVEQAAHPAAYSCSTGRVSLCRRCGGAAERQYTLRSGGARARQGLARANGGDYHGYGSPPGDTQWRCQWKANFGAARR